MDIGLLLHTRQIIQQEDAAQSFEQLWLDAAQAEELGFDHIWLGDSVTVLDKARGDCLTTMAALAARTNSIKIGAVPMLAALRNPVLLAHALATVAADRNENGFKRVGRLGDGWITLAPTLERFTTARQKINQYADEYGRLGKCRVTALYATFNIQSDGDRARDEGWKWMERFFE